MRCGESILQHIIGFKFSGITPKDKRCCVMNNKMNNGKLMKCKEVGVLDFWNSVGTIQELTDQDQPFSAGHAFSSEWLRHV